MISPWDGYDFDDLLLIPRVSHVNSRRDVDISREINPNFKLSIPIIASPMKGIISPKLIIKLSELGGIGILHRFYDDHLEWVETIRYINYHCENWGVAVGINDLTLVRLALDSGAKVICLDVANGYTDVVLKETEALKKLIVLGNYNTSLMSGNIATSEGGQELANAGADMVRVGIGPGALCTTRNVTGVGYPQLSAINDCKEGMDFPHILSTGIADYDIPVPFKYSLVADGGIRNSGDAVKALAMGADFVMLGSLFGQTYESAHNGIIYGMASRKLQEEYYHATKSIEGIEKVQEKKMSLEDFISEFVWGIKSAMTYLNSSTLYELWKNARWVRTGTGSIKRL